MSDKKREQIIAGAIKRFIHFGISKTTMNEIADDLGVSKPSLYYYFPDKNSLIVGVIETISAEVFSKLQKEYIPAKPIETILSNLIDVSHHFFQKYYMLQLAEGMPDNSLNTKEVKEAVQKLRIKNLDFYITIFDNAILKGEILTADAHRIAELYSESLNGLNSLCIMHAIRELFPDKKNLKDVLQKQKELSSIFIKGLKK